MRTTMTTRIETTVTSTTTTVTTTERNFGYTTLSPGICRSKEKFKFSRVIIKEWYNDNFIIFWTLKAYSRLAYVPFADALEESINPKIAKSQFLVFANQISLLGRKVTTQRSRMPSCDFKKAGKIPCYLLAMPENEEICDLVPRVRKLFEFVSNSCNKEWKGYFGEIISEIEEGKVSTIDLRVSSN